MVEQEGQQQGQQQQQQQPVCNAWEVGWSGPMNAQLARGSTGGVLKLKLDGRKTLKLKHSWRRDKGQTMGLELSSPNWGLEWNSNNDVAFERKFSTRLMDVRVKQRVPNQKAFLIPTPEIKVLASPLSVSRWKLRDSFEASWDYMQGKGRFEEELVLDKRWKAKVAGDTDRGLKGLSYTLTAKLGKLWANSLALNYSIAGGSSAKYEVHLGEGSRVKSSLNYKLKSREARLEVQPKLADDSPTRLVISAVQRVDRLSWPSILIGARYEL